MAADNKTIGKFQLKGIKRAPAGAPQIEVTFDIDANGILTVSAKDLGTGNEQSITITDSERMSDSEIEQAIRDAETYAAQDEARREAFVARENAQRLLNEAEQALSAVGKQLEKEEKKQIKADAAAVSKLLAKKPEKMTDADHAALKVAAETLERSSAHARSLASSQG